MSSYNIIVQITYLLVYYYYFNYHMHISILRLTIRLTYTTKDLNE